VIRWSVKEPPALRKAHEHLHTFFNKASLYRSGIFWQSANNVKLKVFFFSSTRNQSVYLILHKKNHNFVLLTQSVICSVVTAVTMSFTRKKKKSKPQGWSQMRSRDERRWPWKQTYSLVSSRNLADKLYKACQNHSTDLHFSGVQFL
jgi:hypothetical protein